ncbi:MAG: glycosyltransferase [Muribaculum sp.]|nr:glycosyltransferase [Muribaculum sp.]
MIYNMAAQYRAPIFKLLDKEFEVDWYYGNPIDGIKELDSSILKRVVRLKRKTIGPFTWQNGVLKLLTDDRYDSYIMVGEPFVISTWLFALLRPIIARNKKLYFWSHGWYGREGFIKKWMKRVFFGLATGTFTYGEYARERAIEQGNNSNKIWAIHNSLDHDKHIELRQSIGSSDIFKKHFGNDYPNIVFIGRLTAVKRLDLILKAVENLKNNGEIYNLTVIGDGEDSDRLKKIASESGIEVWFYGACYDEKTNAELIYNADMCVSPGNVGLTAIHSMTFGTPVITHDLYTQQMPEFEAIRANVTGAFFKCNDVNSLASTISDWFKEHTDRNKVRETCFKEIDSQWTPEYQLYRIKNVLNPSHV